MSQMGALLHSSELLALAVFAHSMKAVNVRSVRLVAENVSCVCAIQQDFVLDPRKYTSVDGPVTLGSFRTFLSTAGMKETLGIIIRMQQTGGWQCVLAFQSYSPSETMIPSVLSPSKNPGLKDVPLLELDLKAVERLSAKPFIFPNDGKSTTGNGWMFPSDGKNAALSKQKSSLQLVYPDLRLAPQSGPNTMEPAKDGNVELEVSEVQASIGQPFDIWQNWGSELELATPKAVPPGASLADRDAAGIARSQLKPMSTLDLNVDLEEISAQEDNSDCSLLSLTQTAQPESPLALETPALSLQQSSITDESTEHSGLESFADSLSSNQNVGLFSKNELVNANFVHYPGSMLSEDSGSCHECVTNMSPTGNATLTSSVVFSAHDKSPCGRKNSQSISCPSIAPRNMCSMEHRNYVEDYEKQLMLQRWGHNIGIVKSKARTVRPGSTSERITEITLQELSQYFSMPITQAAMKLNVGLTVLKKRCREFQIPRWPHRKMKSINSLIGNIKDLAEEQGVKTSPRVLNVVRELEKQRKLMEETPGVELAERTKKLRQACFKANYKKRRLSLSSDNSVHLMHGYVHGRLSPLDWNPTFADSPPQSFLTVDHFV